MGIPSRFSHRWTVVTSRLKCPAISFHEFSRSSGGWTEESVPRGNSPIASLRVVRLFAILATDCNVPGGARRSTVFACKSPQSLEFFNLRFDRPRDVPDSAKAALSGAAKENENATKVVIGSVAQRRGGSHGALRREGHGDA